MSKQALTSLFLLLSIIQSQSACLFTEPKQTCYCRIKYHRGFFDKLKLAESDLAVSLSLPSYDDCGLAQCTSGAIRCRDSCNAKVNALGLSSICSILSPNQHTSAKNNLNVWYSFEYENCASGFGLVFENICCNRACDCKLYQQPVESELSYFVADLKSDLAPAESGFVCSSVSERQDCLSRCLKTASGEKYFNDTSILSFDFKSLGLDVFANDRILSTGCSLLRRTSGPDESFYYSPGTNVYLAYNHSSGEFKLDLMPVKLGNLCCRAECDCSFYGRWINDSNLLTKIIPKNFSFDEGFVCSFNLDKCLDLCRSYFINTYFNTSGWLVDKPLTEMNINVGNIEICQHFLCEGRNKFNFYIKAELKSSLVKHVREVFYFGCLDCLVLNNNFILTLPCQ